MKQKKRGQDLGVSPPCSLPVVPPLFAKKIRQMIFSDFEHFLERYILFHLRIQVDGQNLSSSVLCLESKLRSDDSDLGDYTGKHNRENH